MGGALSQSQPAVCLRQALLPSLGRKDHVPDDLRGAFAGCASVTPALATVTHVCQLPRCSASADGIGSAERRGHGGLSWRISLEVVVTGADTVEQAPPPPPPPP